MTTDINKERFLERVIYNAGLESPISRMPKQLRLLIAEKRYGWGRSLVALQNGKEHTRSLVPLERMNTIFVHVPKAAGLSISRSLFDCDAASHTPLRMYLALYGARRFDAMYKFAFVRNPVDRLVSAFNFLRSGGMTERDALWSSQMLAEYNDINAFVIDGLYRADILKWDHFRPQTSFLLDPRTRRIGVDFIGRFETMEKDYATVCASLNISATLPHFNRSVKKESGLSEQATNIIRKIYEDDFKMLGYN